MLDKLNEIESTALKSLESVTDDDALQAWRVKHTGRSSALMEVFKGIGKAAPEERRFCVMRLRLVRSNQKEKNWQNDTRYESGNTSSITVVVIFVSSIVVSIQFAAAWKPGVIRNNLASDKIDFASS